MHRTVTRRWATLPAALVIAAVTACEPVATEPITALDLAPQQLSAAGGESARGHIEIGLMEGQSHGTYRYSFTARRLVDGTVRGQFQVTADIGTEFEFRAHGEVICMTVSPDGTAHLGGRITNTNPDVPEDSPMGAIWSVKDNGEGRRAVDAGSFIGLGADLEFVVNTHCVSGTFPPEASGRGNVQVTPAAII